MVLAFDLDGVFADFSTAYANLLIRCSGIDLLPEGWKTNREWQKVWFWEREAGYEGKWEQTAWKDHILVDGHFWRDLDPLPDAEEVLKRLNVLSRGEADIYFLTHRMGFKAKRQTENWLYDHGFDFPSVILTGDKIPVLKSLGATFFIDDKPPTLNDAVVNLKGCTVYVMDAAYNRDNVRREAIRVTSVKGALEHFGAWK